MEKPIIIIGHKNPDTDSIAAALCYAELKNKTEKGARYIAKRAGHINEETQFVLEYFKMKAPDYMKDVSTQVKDIDIREGDGIPGGISLKKVWEKLTSDNIHSVAVMDGKKVKGMISMSDVAKSYMDVYDNRILSKAKTPYKNIAETLEGSILAGPEDGIFDKGKVLITAANPDIVEHYIEEGDMVICGNRVDDQLCAIENKAACIIICEGAKVSPSIISIADNRNCAVIVTDYDAYTTSRLINQSISVDYFMVSGDLVSFKLDDTVDMVKEVLAKKRFRNYPVLDEDGNYVGMLSRRNVLGAKKKQVILVDHNERNQAAYGIDEASILEIIDHHRLGTIETITPVFFRNQPLGSTCTIIYQMFKEKGIVPGKKFAGLMCAAILSDTLIYRSPTCTEIDKISAKELAKIAGINDEEFARNMFRAGSNLGVKSVKEILYRDYKKFLVGEVTFSIGQVNLMGEDEIAELKPRIIDFMREDVADGEVIFFMMTNIMTESSEVICSNSVAREIIEDAYNVKMDGDSVCLKGVVSRKKQLVPAIIESMQQ